MCESELLGKLYNQEVQCVILIVKPHEKYSSLNRKTLKNDWSWPWSYFLYWASSTWRCVNRKLNVAGKQWTHSTLFPLIKKRSKNIAEFWRKISSKSLSRGRWYTACGHVQYMEQKTAVWLIKWSSPDKTKSKTSIKTISCRLTSKVVKTILATEEK